MEVIKKIMESTPLAGREKMVHKMHITMTKQSIGDNHTIHGNIVNAPITNKEAFIKSPDSCKKTDDSYSTVLYLSEPHIYSYDFIDGNCTSASPDYCLLQLNHMAEYS